MLTPAEVTNIKSRISSVLTASSSVAPARVDTLLDIKNNSLQGKLYEAWVLATICEGLSRTEGLTLRFLGGSRLQFKMKGGPINRSFPYFEVYRDGRLWAELFTDTYFHGLSCQRCKGDPGTPGDYHELDIALLRTGLTGIPEHDQVLIAVECKNTPAQKHIIREVLGFRRELSCVQHFPRKTEFDHWPADYVCSDPASVHMLYCSDPHVLDYKPNCRIFGILLEHLRLP
jgi:hypothetical protein